VSFTPGIGSNATIMNSGPRFHTSKLWWDGIAAKSSAWEVPVFRNNGPAASPVTVWVAAAA
jgi:hypothetical protein